MKILQELRTRFAQLLDRITLLLGKERIERINERITYYPDQLRARMPVWTHRFIDPIKPYLQNPKYVWRFSGTVIILLLTIIAYRSLHDSKQMHFKQVATVEYDEIEAPEGGFNSEYVRSVTVHEQQVDDHLVVPGRLAYDGNEIRTISARVPGRVERIYIHAGYPAKKGEPVMSLYSPEFLSAEQEYLLANHAFAAVSGIKDHGIINDARDLTEAARNKLLILGMDESEISKLKHAGTPLPLLTIKSPIDGVVTDQSFKPGAYVALGTDVATVAGLQTIWFKGNVYEQDIQKVRPGQPLVVKSDAYPGSEFQGVVDFVSPGMDPATHTLIIRATLRNADSLLKPDVYVNGIVTTGSERRVVIPKESLIKEGNNAYVIQVLPGNHYKLRNVSISPVDDSDTIAILRGLKDGNEIVTTGSVLVYESIKRKIR